MTRSSHRIKVKSSAKIHILSETAKVFHIFLQEKLLFQKNVDLMILKTKKK